jgi:hypothetical protein
MKVSLSKLAPVRHSSPWGRLGGVIPFGEGLGERPLLFSSEGLGEAL